MRDFAYTDCWWAWNNWNNLTSGTQRALDPDTASEQTRNDDGEGPQGDDDDDKLD